MRTRKQVLPARPRSPHPRSGRRHLVAVVLVAVGAVLATQGGGVTAATLITGRQVRDGSLTGLDVRDGSVVGADVRDGSLTTADAPSAVVGPPGPPGPAGEAGAVGAPGPPGVRDIVRVYKLGSAALPGGRGAAQVACPPGRKALGGGVYTSIPDAPLEVVTSAPLNDGAGWLAVYHNAGTADLYGYGWAICAFTS